MMSAEQLKYEMIPTNKGKVGSLSPRRYLVIFVRWVFNFSAKAGAFKLCSNIRSFRFSANFDKILIN